MVGTGESTELIQASLLLQGHHINRRFSAEADLNVAQFPSKLGLLVDVPATAAGVFNVQDLSILKLVLSK